MSLNQRIAKAIHASLSDAPSLDADLAWDRMTDEDQAPYRVAARRVLRIMRAPTEDMLRAGNFGPAQDAANVWERMIFRALNEGAG